DLSRVNADANVYFPLNYPFWELKHTLAIGTKAGSTLSLYNHRVPSYERFYSTGPYLIRGWAESLPNSLQEAEKAVLFQGDSVALASTEYRFPIFSIVSGVLFADTGLFWNQESQPTDLAAFNLAHLRSGYGVGVRVNTPLGPLRLDLGLHDLNLKDWGTPDYWSGLKKETGVFPNIAPHFSIGQKF
ncbi:MAG: BamA/TamA family outer membrane protein, partial [Candidatus Sericytochromatia bacterium]|nr:BamA/TamA family outer membrane protein [Candidatus Tanganyikabacteria bacterium]